MLFLIINLLKQLVIFLNFFFKYILIYYIYNKNNYLYYFSFAKTIEINNSNKKF